MAGTKVGAKKGWDKRRGRVKMKKGDTLSGIAEMYSVSVKSLIDLNDLKSLNDVYDGRKIRLR